LNNSNILELTSQESTEPYKPELNKVNSKVSYELKDDFGLQMLKTLVLYT